MGLVEMFQKSVIFTAILVAIVTGLTISADERGFNPAGIASRKSDFTREIDQTSRPGVPKQGLSIRRTRVLFLTKQNCERCEQELDRLRKSGGDFEKLQSVGWKIGETPDSHIQIINSDLTPEIIDLLKPGEYPAVACVADGEIVRSFKSGCTTPLDAWTFGWLLKGVSERPQAAISEAARVETTGHYRLRGNHWTIEGDPNPSKESVVYHLRGANHANSVAPYGTIESWSYEELRSLHDDIHEREGGAVAGYYSGPVGPPQANRSLDAFSGSRKATGR